MVKTIAVPTALYHAMPRSNHSGQVPFGQIHLGFLQFHCIMRRTQCEMCTIFAKLIDLEMTMLRFRVIRQEVAWLGND